MKQDNASESNKEQQLNELLKFRNLRIYSSTEWLADNKKKYRQVFYRKEVNFLYIEFSFVNKNFDRQNWDVGVELRCYRIAQSRKRVCSLNISRQVSKYDNIVYIREGWGNKQNGSFWKKGKYVWEAWVNGLKAGSKYFYIEDIPQYNEIFPKDYMSVKNMYFYEGSYDNDDKDQRQLTIFDAEATRYVYSEISCKNNLSDKDWMGEFILRYSNEARELKGEIKKLINVKKDEEEFKIAGGWGSNVKGSWRKGLYVFELVFMERLIIQTTFEVDTIFEEGLPELNQGNAELIYDGLELEDELKSAKEVFREFHSLVGLRDIKKQINDHATYISFLNLRKLKGFNENSRLRLHSVFTGNPGTGKTTVANLMGALYKSIGMLKKGHVHMVDRVDLVGEFIGQTAPKVKAAIEKAKGGVLFIDEAYALARSHDDNKDFGKEVIEILVKEMGNPECDFMVIAAGYPAEMDYFINSNPGLKSRFKQIFEFKDYSLNELYQIIDKACSKFEVYLTPSGKRKIEELITVAFREKDENFGNARFVYDLIERAKVQMALRLMAVGGHKPEDETDLDLEGIQLIDVLSVESGETHPIGQLPLDQALLDASLKELDKLIGLSKIKEEIHQLIEIVQFHKGVGNNPLHAFNLHTLFIGNPGTGKNTVARILANIYKALGLIEKGHLVEVDRHALVAGFVGQSAIKTSEQIDRAMDGVLFIDEAYALNTGHSNDFGAEVIQTLLKRMEDDRGRFFVFAAGYTENMKTFLKSNPGLSSRFDRTFQFPDFEAYELNDVALYFLKERGYYISSKAATALNEFINDLHLKKDKFFGNARVVRNLMLELIKAQNYRLSSMREDKISNHIMMSIKLEDVEKMINQNRALSLSREVSIGFGQKSGG